MLQRRGNTCMKRPLQAHPGIAQKKETRILSPEEDLWRHQADKLGICSSCWPLHLLSSPCWYKMVVKWRWIWCLSSFEEGISWRGLFLTPSELNMKCSYVLSVTLFFFFFSIIASYIILWLIAALDVFGSPGVIYRLTAIPMTGGVFLWFVFNGVVISTTMTFAELKASMLVTQQVCQGACLLVFLCWNMNNMNKNSAYNKILRTRFWPN